MSTSNKIDDLFNTVFGSLSHDSWSFLPSKPKTLSITKLDNGYLLTSNGKQSAYSDIGAVLEAAKAVMEAMK